MHTIIIPTTPERREQTARLLCSIWEHTKDIKYRTVVYENNDGGWVKAIYNAIDGIDGYVWLLGCDTVLQNNALKILRDTYDKNFQDNTGVCEPFNEIQGSTLCQHPFAHVDTIKKYLHKGYVHNFSDNEFTDRVVADGKFVYVPDAKIEHRHVINGKAEMDQTYKTIFNEETIEKDRDLYKKRKANGYK